MPSSVPVLAAVLTLSCAGVLHNVRPMAPEQAGAAAWQRLAQLRSFGFALTFHTDMPLPIEVRFNGIREQADREKWSGYMGRRTEMSRVELRAEGAEQYEKDPSGWHRTLRGIETRVLEQGEGALGSKPLKFIRAEHGRYLFAFKPDLPILDPSQSKLLTGVMEVDARSGLPVRLYCSDSAKTGEWELRLGRFNRAGSVSIPYEPAMTIDARPTGRVSPGEINRALASMGERLSKLGWEHRLSRTPHGLVLLLRQPKSRRQVELLFSRGNVEVWQGRWTGTGESSDAAVEVGGDAARRVVLERRLAANEQIAAAVRTTTPQAAALVTSVVLPDDRGLAVLVVNRTAVSAASPGPDGELVFQDIGSADDVSLVAALANSGTIPTDFGLTVKP